MTSPRSFDGAFGRGGLLPATDPAEVAELMAVVKAAGPEIGYAATTPARELPQAVRAGMDASMQLAAMGVMLWPAVVYGRVNPPPAGHVLEALVRQRLLNVADETATFMALALLPEAMTVAILDRQEHCEVCALDGRTARAVVDCPILSARRSVWAFHCAGCLLERPGFAQLGEGYGQWLVLEDDVPADVLAAFEEARSFWAQATPASLEEAI